MKRNTICKSNRTLRVAALAAAIAVGIGSYASAQSVSPDLNLAQVTPEAGVMTFGLALETGDVGRMMVRVMGPKGDVVLERSTAGEPVALDAAKLPDGNYRYEMWIFTPPEEAPAGNAEGGTIEMLLDRKTDMFEVIGGQLRTFDRDERGAVEDGLGAHGSEDSSLLGSIASAAVDFVFPSAHADTNSGSGVAREIWDDTAIGDSFDWFADLDANNSGFTPGTDVGAGFYMHDDINDSGSADFHTVFAIAHHPSNNENSFIVDSSGDIGFANNSMFVDRSGNRLGLGTTTPRETIDVVNGDTPGIRLDDGLNGDWTIEEFGNNLEFSYNETGGGTFFEINTDGNVLGFGLDGTITAPAGQSDTFFYNADSGFSNPDRMFWAHSPGQFADWGIEYSDNVDEMYFQTSSATAGRFVTFDFGFGVGIGSGNINPETPLHVRGSTSSNAKLLVENTTGTQGQRNLFELRNAGKTRFVIENTGSGIWTFDNAGATFDISRAGTGIAEFQVFTNGNARLQNGEMLAQGFTVISSREAKTDFAAVDAASMLDKVSQLEISEWQYKADEAAKRHIGPVAEDFAEVFGIGNGKTISVSDTAGIAFAAIQGLREEVRSRDDQIAELRSELDELRRMIQDAND